MTDAEGIMESGIVESMVAIHLEGIERALDRGDVSAARTCLDGARRRLLGVEELRPPRTCLPSSLTEREVATLRLLPDACLSQKDMARTLGVSLNTVKSHLRSVYQKLGVHSRAEAIEVAQRLGIIDVWHVREPVLVAV